LAVLWRKLAPTHPLYALAHDFAMRHVPPLGRALQKIGAIAANKASAERVLQTGGNLLVYPGGDLDAYRTSRRRNHVIISPRCGFVKVAQAHNVPIVPVVAAGAHRSAFIFGDGEWIARSLQMKSWARLERFPLALALPWGFAPGPWLPYLPLPFQVRLKFLPPISVDPSDDPVQVAREIEATMQQTLTGMVQR
jgi:1-acyl-sn-glycerol-3-phosphate acyltransferase